MERPYLYNDDYIEASKRSKFFNMPDSVYLTPFNEYICTFYQSLNEKFNNFELAFNLYFSNVSRLQKQYVLIAINTLDSIMQRHAYKEAEKQRHKQSLKAKNESRINN